MGRGVGSIGAGGPVISQPTVFPRSSPRVGINRFRKVGPQVPPPPFDPTMFPSGSGSSGGGAGAFCRDIFVSTVGGKALDSLSNGANALLGSATRAGGALLGSATNTASVLRDASNATAGALLDSATIVSHPGVETVPTAAAPIAEAAATVASTVSDAAAGAAATVTSTVSDAATGGLGESVMKVVSPIGTALSWGWWGFRWLPATAQWTIGILAAIVAWRVIRGGGSGSSSSSAKVDVHVNFHGTQPNVSVNGPNGAATNVPIPQNMPGAFPVAPYPAAPNAAMACVPVGMGLGGQVLLSCQMGGAYAPQDPYNPRPMLDTYGLRCRLRKNVDNIWLSPALRGKIKSFLNKMNGTSAADRMKNRNAYFEEANLLFEEMYQERLQFGLDECYGNSVDLPANFGGLIKV